MKMFAGKSSSVMRGLFLVVGSGLCQNFLSVGTGQEVRTPCTALYLHLPSYVVSGSAPLPIKLDISGAKELLGDEKTRQLVFRWEVSDATIVSGQGTPNITVDIGKPQALGVRNVVVAVDVKGIPPYCETGLTRSLRINPACASPPTFDTYCDLPLKSEESRLDALANALKADPNSVAYILAYAGQGACIWEAEWRTNRAKKYLVEKRAIDSERVITMDGGFREKSVIEIFVAARDGCGPLPMPTRRSDDFRIAGQCSDKYSNPDR